MRESSKLRIKWFFWRIPLLLPLLFLLVCVLLAKGLQTLAKLLAKAEDIEVPRWYIDLGGDIRGRYRKAKRMEECVVDETN